MRFSVFCNILLLWTLSLQSQEKNFKFIALGSSGGPQEAHLSGYLCGSLTESSFIALDAGSLLAGIEIAYKKGAFSKLSFDSQSSYTPAAQVLRNHLKGVFLSHPHLDHVGALIINSTLMRSTDIYGTDFTIDTLRDHLFNWSVWPNLGSEGKNPLHLLTYHRLKGKVEVKKSALTVEPFPLSHSESYFSTAFLIKEGKEGFLYLGDTGADRIEKSENLFSLWKTVVPLINAKKLHGIVIECSFDDSTPVEQLYGHLTPSLIVEELTKLASLVPTLGELPILVVHMKRSFQKDSSIENEIKEKLLSYEKKLGVRFLFPKAGDAFEL
jgi:cAMP phosphodiesterase